MRTYVRVITSLSSEELHWVAGMLEGEGTFMTGPPSNPRAPILAIHMTDEDVMARLGRIFDRKVQVIRPRRVRWQTSYFVRVQGADAVRWMTLLRPLMGARRRTQIDRALACYAPRSVALLDDEKARAALEALAAGATVKQVAARFGVTIWCIYDLRLGRTFKHLPRERPTRAAAADALEPAAAAPNHHLYEQLAAARSRADGVPPHVRQPAAYHPP
jgi:hypothetical protein